jgi:putative SOS response-associated peptidase YedK
MFGRNESESFGYGSATCTQMDRQGRPNEPQLVYRRDPETGRPVEGLLRWGLIPHFCEKRPDFPPIHARAETVAEKEWFRDAYRRRRCVVPMNNFFQKDHDGSRHVISRRRRTAFRCRGDMGKVARTSDGQMGADVRQARVNGSNDFAFLPLNVKYVQLIQ